MAEHKLLGIVVAAGLLIVGAIFMVIDRNSVSPDDPGEPAVAVVAPEPAEPSSEPRAEHPVLPVPLSGKIVVSKSPIEILASPSGSASALYGFPAGRPFRVLGGNGDYVKVQDVRSGASGWIEEAALEPAPPPEPMATPTPSTTKTMTQAPTPSANQAPTPRKQRSSSDTATVAVQPKPKPPPTRERRGLFGGNGPFRGLFGGR
jgi:hypothetical protein